MRITERADSRRLSRADFLRLSGLTATAVLLGTGELQSGRAYAAPSFAADPFSLGVASGDPEHNSVVLWTRLAPEPLAADGHGGMPPDPVTVRYEVATDDGFHHVVHHGAVEATAELGHSVHAEVRGLRPGYEYFYRFKAGADTSCVGRTRTTPVGHVDSLRFALRELPALGRTASTRAHARDRRARTSIWSCSSATTSTRTGSAPRRMRRQRADALRTELHARSIDYRSQYGLYKSDPDLQAAHAARPWIVDLGRPRGRRTTTRALIPIGRQRDRGVPARRAAAYQAYYEHMPLRRSSCRPAPTCSSIARSRSAGSRSSCCSTSASTAATRCAPTTGHRRARSRSTRRARCSAIEQEAWLLDGLRRSHATWNVLAQQVIMCRADRDPGPGARTSMDNWNGYSPARQRLFDGVADARRREPGRADRRRPLQPGREPPAAVRRPRVAGDRRGDRGHVGLARAATAPTSTSAAGSSSRATRTWRFYNARRGYAQLRV